MLKTSNLTLVKKGNLEYIKFPKIEKTGIVNHLFSTRMGGVSEGCCSSMNLSFNRGEPRENVLKNYEIICAAENIKPVNLVLSAQTHTNNVICVTKADCGTGIFSNSFSDVDGLITNQRQVALVTQYADCTPLLFCDPVKRVVATSHAGWRGTVKQIGRITVEKMCKEYGCNAENIIVGIGPCIKECCYEVDDPVFSEFKKLGFLNLDTCFIKKENGKYMLNLVNANKQILLDAGILPQNIDESDICTCCNSQYLHSHRATNGKRGNLAAIIELK